MTPAEFVSQVRAAIREVMPDRKAATERLILAHAALESGWGSSQAFRRGRALFNITQGDAKSARVVIAGDLEYRQGAAPVRIVQRFRAYDSLADSVRDYLRLLTLQRYQLGQCLDALLAGDLDFVRRLGLCGFYTLPLHEYRERFDGVLARVDAELAQLDSQTAA